jgi:hypothetical protein
MPAGHRSPRESPVERRVRCTGAVEFEDPSGVKDGSPIVAERQGLLFTIQVFRSIVLTSKRAEHDTAVRHGG